MSDNSEFICHVVRILATELHPGADRLELVTISLDGETPFPSKIVNSKGGYKPGDLAVYVGPDSVVPLGKTAEGAPGPFYFLNDRLDAKGKTHYRIRSARIRGIYSPGLLVGLPSGDLSCGADVSEALGVTNYDAEPQSTRAHGDGKLSSVRAKDIYPVYGVSSLKKCPYLFREGEQVVITEKIHGTNFRFGYGGKRRFYYGTHRTNLQDCRSWFTRLRDFLLRRSVVNSNPGFGNPWSRAVEQYDLESKCKDAREYIFYGEIFGPGIQAGFDYSFTEPDIRIFDVYNPKTGEWLDYYERYGLVCSIGLLPVPSLYSGEFSLQRVKQLAEEASWFDGGLREGVVVESLAEQKKGKWVSEAYHLAKVSDAT